MAKKSNTPISVVINTFNVGFGDSFLLVFKYSENEADDRRVLIDFGSMATPLQKVKASKKDIANKIAEFCGPDRKLHAVVATHRHSDHISGFATTPNGRGPGDVIASLEPDLVSQPWTEQLDLPQDARGPEVGPRGFTNRLTSMSQVARHAAANAFRYRLDENRAQLDRIRFIGEDNVSNLSAIDNLAAMGRNGRAEFLHTGAKSKLEKILPGVKVHVLGPPTLKQAPSISRMRSRHEGEFWHLQARATGAIGAHSPFGAAKQSLASLPPDVRWFVRRLNLMRSDMLYGIVTALDDQMNNTSLILLFEVGKSKKKFLFPGDAQWENWEYALSQPKYQELLADVDVYKVGHHGSLNATPKASLWQKFRKRGTSSKKGSLQTILSTREGKHGDPASRSEVPRATLVNQLHDHSHLTNTQDFEDGELVRSLEIKV